MSPSDCALIIPASGFSSRFGVADKLLAHFGGRPLADYAAQTASKIGFAQMIAVVPPNCPRREEVFKARGFKIVRNANAAKGQNYSIKLGVQAIEGSPKSICIMLADMPLVPKTHVLEMIEAAPKDGVIKTEYEGHHQPPAVFTGKACHAWFQADAVNEHLAKLARTEQAFTLPLSAPFGDDVDTVRDAARLSKYFKK